MTELGRFVYYRTYARWLPDKRRRETWMETVARAVDFNIGLELKYNPTASLDDLRREAEELFDNIFYLRQFLSGRSLWVGGTPVAEKFPLSLFNCAFLVLDDFNDFADLFYLLMVGAGVGFRALPEDVEKLDKYRPDVRLVMLPYNGKLSYDREDWTSLAIEGNVATIVVGDSKEGWVAALNLYFTLLTSYLYRDIREIKINFDNVRPKGERLKTFGGTASGYESLQKMFEKIHKVMVRGNGKLRPIDVLDIANIIGENVVVGGVRRTSEIGIFSPDDIDVVQAKSNVFVQDESGEWILNQELSHRTMSNNSLWFDSKPTREKLHEIFQSLKTTGEPGFINGQALRKRRVDGRGMNPCLTGDMCILTADGYVPIKELVDKNVKLINKDGEAVEGKVWFSGRKPTVKLVLSNGRHITCTADHRFMTTEGREIMAGEAMGHRLLSYDGNSPDVLAVESTNKIEDVYDFSEPKTNWGVVEGVITHNCGEVLLDDKQTCNLVTNNVMAFVTEDGQLDKKGLFRAFELSARAAYRMTFVDLEIPDWDRQQKKDRLVGVSLTGWQDMVSVVGMSRKEQAKLLRELRKTVRNSVNEYASELGLDKPLLSTSVKPEGSLSQLPTVSSGVHYPHSPYYIRRVRINAHDPLVKVAEELDWPVYPEVGQGWETCSIKIIEFPVKSPSKTTKYEVSAIEQLENYKMFMRNYVEHNVSITVTVREHEWDEVEQWVWDNWDDIVAITFLALDEHIYPLAPYEAITEEEYERRVNAMRPFDPSLLPKYETGEDFDIENLDGCEGGVCPIR
jgi:ribonucleotide reductase alpha subunit